VQTWGGPPRQIKEIVRRTENPRISELPSEPLGSNGHASGRTGTGRSFQMQFDFERLVVPKVTSHDDTRPESRFALRFAALLEADPAAKFDNPALSRLAQEGFGKSAGFGRAAYDAAEAGFNIYLSRIGLDLADKRSAIEKLLAEQARLPTQTRRNQEQIEFQQFSTPPAQALLVVTAAAIREGMKVLEPSAGTGNLAVLARLAGADVDTNEINERRVRLLLLQGFAPTAFDAERLDNLLWPERLYDAVVMNPPFSATGGRVKGHNTHFGARHVEQALLRLKPSGRLVAIVGGGMALDRPGFRDWWAAIEGRYRVRANIGMDGNGYAKFGTTFDNQIIVIDHEGPTESEADIITGRGLSIHAGYELLSNLSKEDVYGQIRGYYQKPGGRCLSQDLQRGAVASGGPSHLLDGLGPANQ